MPLFYAVLAAVGAWFLGMLVFIGTPVLAAELPAKYSRPVANTYRWLSNVAFGRVLLVARKHAGLKPCASRFDIESGTETVHLDGEQEDFPDVGSRMRYMGNTLYGIALERVSAIVDPIDAEIGRAKRRLEAQGELSKPVEAFDGVGTEAGGQTALAEHALLDSVPKCLKMDEATWLMGSSGEPTDVETSENFAERSQEKLRSTNYMNIMLFAVLFVVGLIGVYAVFSLMQGGGGGGAGDAIERGIYIGGFM